MAERRLDNLRIAEARRAGILAQIERDHGRNKTLWKMVVCDICGRTLDLSVPLDRARISLWSIGERPPDLCPACK